MQSDQDQGRLVLGRIEQGSVEIAPPIATDGSHYAQVPMVVAAPGLSAETMFELEDWGGGWPGLVSFFEDLGPNWRGWTGTKEWTDDHANVSFKATHDQLGTVLLHIAIPPAFRDTTAGAWGVSVIVALDAGLVTETAQRIHRLFETGPSTT